MNVAPLIQAIRDIPDFPKPGVLFKDITPVLLDADLFRLAIDLFVERHRHARLDKVAAIEARGFILGAAVARELGVGLIPVRKQGKLPANTVAESYALEYGEATLEVHEDAVATGDQILLIDDLLATGGTAEATVSLVEKLGGSVAEIDFLIELTFLQGRKKLGNHPVFAPICY